jgi:hypothetical protein
MVQFVIEKGSNFWFVASLSYGCGTREQKKGEIGNIGNKELGNKLYFTDLDPIRFSACLEWSNISHFNSAKIHSKPFYFFLKIWFLKPPHFALGLLTAVDRGDR